MSDRVTVIKKIKDGFIIKSILESIPKDDIDFVVQFEYGDSERAEIWKMNFFDEFNDIFENGGATYKVVFTDTAKELYDDCYYTTSVQGIESKIIKID